MGGELLKAGDCGSLYCDGDSRHVLCFTKFDFGMKQNIMFSFNPNSWECRCCPGKVLLKRGTGSRSEPITFVLSDQNFPACLPAQPGSSLQCLKIIRVEFGSLWELCNVFIELIKNDDLSVPTGTTILIGSASHLSNVGLSAYAEELDCMLSWMVVFTACPAPSSSAPAPATRSWSGRRLSWSAGSDKS